MAEYKILIKNARTQMLVSEFSFSEKSSGEAKALAYVHGKEQCSLLPDGEYTCELLVKQFLFGFENDRVMPMFGYRVTQRCARLSVDKEKFGGEATALQAVKDFMMSNAGFVAKNLINTPEFMHTLFFDNTKKLIDALGSLHTTYKPDYLDNAIFNYITTHVQKEIDEEKSAYQDFAIGKGDPELYHKKVAKAYIAIVTVVSQTFINEI